MFARNIGIVELDNVNQPKVVLDIDQKTKINEIVAQFFGMKLKNPTEIDKKEPRFWLTSNLEIKWGIPDFCYSEKMAFAIFQYIQVTFNKEHWNIYFNFLCQTILDRIPHVEDMLTMGEIMQYFQPIDAVVALANYLKSLEEPNND